jgi:hypothetical protein
MQPVRLRLKLCTLPFLLCCTWHNSRKAAFDRGVLTLDKHGTRCGGVGCQAYVEEPTTVIADFWPRAASGHAAAVPRSVMNSRRLTRLPHRRGRVASAKIIRSGYA